VCDFKIHLLVILTDLSSRCIERNASNSSVHFFHHLFLSLGKLHILYNGIELSQRAVMLNK